MINYEREAILYLLMINDKKENYHTDDAIYDINHMTNYEFLELLSAIERNKS